MAVNLMQANRQWASRPADERFWSIADAAAAALATERGTYHLTEQYSDVEVIPQGEDLALIIPGNSAPATFSHWSFGQFAKKAGAPAGYLADLPAPLAAECLNTGLRKRRNDDAGLFSLARGAEGITLRASLSDEFGAIPNSSVFTRAQALVDRGWKVPPARPAVNDPRARRATEADVSAYAHRSPLSIKVGDMIAPAGVYASDRDMFAILTDETRPVHNPADPNHPLFRGLMLWNSDVGARSFGLVTFLYDVVCGNHIVWGATEVNEFRTYHRGSDAERRAFARMAEVAMNYAEGSATGIEAAIVGAQQRLIASTLDEIPELVTSKRQLSPILSKRLVKEAIEIAVSSDRYGDPRSPWALSQGLTELSQRNGNTNDRTEIDRAAGRILDLF